MKEFLKYIPGFRTGEKSKKVIALIYYVICLLTISSSFWRFVALLTLPFIIFYGIDAFKSKSKKYASICLIAFIIMCFGINNIPQVNPSQATNTNVTSNTKGKKTVKSVSNNSNKTVTGNLKVHYIDVGQGDSELIQQNGENMLIDTGTNASTDVLISYLQEQNVKKIDYLVLTHPHEDHIGGADAVINKFDIGTIYMPKVTANTKTFEDVIIAMNNKGLKATTPSPGDKFKLGEVNCEILGPVNIDNDDLNTYSIVLKITFGDNKFIFTGDAQVNNEQDMINKGYDLSADVLKIGHHGSNTSTSQDFLDKVNPEYAVISCGKNNDYGHPHKETMEKLQAKNIEVYRTDENSTIVCTSDGKNINFSCKPGDYNCGNKTESANNTNNLQQQQSQSQQSNSSNSSQSNSATEQSQIQQPSTDDNQNVTVYITRTGHKYHLAGCRYLARSQIPILLKEAKLEGYTPCSVCNPPN